MAEVVKVSKSAQKKSILNWFLSCAVGGNYEFMHGVGFMYSMVPVVKLSLIHISEPTRH